MSNYHEALRDLSALLIAIEPFGSSVVPVGGFAAWLYRFVDPYDANGPELHTFDIDYAVPRRLPIGVPSLVKALDGIEFVALHSRDQDPPVMALQHRRWPEDGRPYRLRNLPQRSEAPALSNPVNPRRKSGR